MLQVASTTSGPAPLARGAPSGDGGHGCPEEMGMGWGGVGWDRVGRDRVGWDGRDGIWGGAGWGEWNGMGGMGWGGMEWDKMMR